MGEKEFHSAKGTTPDEAMLNLEEEVETYVNKYIKAISENETIIADAIEKSTQTINPTAPSSSSTVEHIFQQKGGFQNIQHLQPKEFSPPGS